MKFYFKTWFILGLIILCTGLLFSVLFLFDLVTELDILGATNNQSEKQTILDQSDQLSFAYSATAPSRGNLNARIRVVGFLDFQCPFCREENLILQEIWEKHPADYYYQFRNFALSAESRQIAEASLCANEQGKFWEYHDLLFANQQALNVVLLQSLASEAKLNEEDFVWCLESHKYADAVAQDYNDALKLEVLATPTFFINDHKVQGVIPLEIWEKILRVLP